MISPFNVLLIIFGIVSLLSFSLRNLRTPSSVARINMKVAAPPNSLSTSLRTCGLPVMNMRVSGDPCKICPNDSRTTIRFSGTHSSRASMHINVRLVSVSAWNIFRIPETCSPLPPITLFSFSNSWTIAWGIFPCPLTSCLRREPSIFTGDCSFREAKSK